MKYFTIHAAHPKLADLATLAVSLVLLAGPVLADELSQGTERGKYLVTVMDCAGCHMPRGANGVPMAEKGLSGGNVGFEIPGMGIFWPSNLTPDETGLGSFSEAEIASTIRTGVRPDGSMLAPVMPTPSYAALSDEDAAAIAAYLKSLPPAKSTAAPAVADAADAQLPFYRVTMPGTK
jgi:mono/diheme cytochrome c family protein